MKGLDGEAEKNKEMQQKQWRVNQPLQGVSQIATVYDSSLCLLSYRSYIPVVLLAVYFFLSLFRLSSFSPTSY